MSAKLPESESQLAELGSVALAVLAGSGSVPNEAARTEAQQMLKRMETLFRLGPDKGQILAYPFPLRDLKWIKVQDAATTLISSGQGWDGFRWLCLSVCNNDVNHCYAHLSNALSACAHFAESDLAWKDQESDDIADSMSLMADGLVRLLRGHRVELSKSKQESAPEQISALGNCLVAVNRVGGALANRGIQDPDLGALRMFISQLLDPSAGRGQGQSKPAASGAPAEPRAPVTAEPVRRPQAEPPAARPAPMAAAGASQASPDRVAGPSAQSFSLPSEQPGGPSNPLPYLARRAELWSSQPASPAATPGPSEEEREKILEELAQPDLAPIAALDRAEALLGRYPLWLELQPQVTGWLERIGAAQARDAVRVATAGLLAARPNLLGAQAVLSSGVRLLSEESAAFLRDDAETLRELPLPPRAPQVDDLRSELLAAQQRIARADSARQRFVLRLEMSESCRAAGRFDLAIGTLAGLLQEAEQFRLSTWEPALMKRLLRTYLSIAAEREAGIALDVQRRLLSQLCHLDPLEAERF